MTRGCCLGRYLFVVSSSVEVGIILVWTRHKELVLLDAKKSFNETLQFFSFKDYQRKVRIGKFAISKRKWSPVILTLSINWCDEMPLVVCIGLESTPMSYELPKIKETSPFIPSAKTTFVSSFPWKCSFVFCPPTQGEQFTRRFCLTGHYFLFFRLICIVPFGRLL